MAHKAYRLSVGQFISLEGLTSLVMAAAVLAVYMFMSDKTASVESLAVVVGGLAVAQWALALIGYFIDGKYSKEFTVRKFGQSLYTGTLFFIVAGGVSSAILGHTAGWPIGFAAMVVFYLMPSYSIGNYRLVKPVNVEN